MRPGFDNIRCSCIVASPNNIVITLCSVFPDYFLCSTYRFSHLFTQKKRKEEKGRGVYVRSTVRGTSISYAPQRKEIPHLIPD